MPADQVGLPGRAPARRWRWALGTLVILVAIGVAIVFGIQWRFRAEALEVRLGRALTEKSDSLYHVKVGSAHLSLLGKSYVVTDLEITLDSARLLAQNERGTRPRVRYSVRIPRVRLDGIKLGAMARGEIVMDDITVTAPDFQVYLDRTVKDRPGDTTRIMPHQLLQQSGRAVRIGAIRVDDGEVHYSEMASDGARPGKFRFGEIQLAIANVTNDAEVAAAKGPGTIKLAVKLGGVARLGANFEYDLLEPKFSMRYEGGLSATDPRVFNSMLTDLNGIKITKGQVDTVWFKIDVKDDVARGRVRAIYRDLRIEMLDKITRKQDLGDKIGNFISNNFKLRTDNPEGHHGDPPLTATVYLPRNPRAPMLQFLWHSVRAGLAKTMGV